MKLTKTQLREEQTRLGQLEKYVPTLQLKKAMLQLEILETISQKHKIEEKFLAADKLMNRSAILLSDDRAVLLNTLKVEKVSTHIENIAGVEVPIFDCVEFSRLDYTFVDTPVWFDKILNNYLFVALILLFYKFLKYYYYKFQSLKLYTNYSNQTCKYVALFLYSLNNQPS